LKGDAKDDGENEKQADEETEEKGITLEEYLAKNKTEESVAINEAKSKITKGELLKEMGTAT